MTNDGHEVVDKFPLGDRGSREGVATRVWRRPEKGHAMRGQWTWERAGKNCPEFIGGEAIMSIPCWDSDSARR